MGERRSKAGEEQKGLRLVSLRSQFAVAVGKLMKSPN